jgi:periplasmic protein TonB
MSSRPLEVGAGAYALPERISADRLSSTIFFAALAHGALILGVTFTSWPSASDTALPSLKVTLVIDTSDLRDSDDEAWLAQANLAGGGEAAPGVRPTTSLAADQLATLAGDPTAADAADGRPREPAQQAEEILTRGPSERQIEALPKAAEDPSAELEMRAALLDRTAQETLAAEIDDRAELPTGDDANRPPAPSTRESVLAVYLDAWRRRVERIGTLNFPAMLNADNDTGRPTLEVAIGPGGELAEIVVRRSSGNTALDQAALTILRLASPFEPLPDEIRAEYDVLRFAYEWDFDAGAATAGSARASE